MSRAFIASCHEILHSNQTNQVSNGQRKYDYVPMYNVRVAIAPIYLLVIIYMTMIVYQSISTFVG